MVTALAPCPSQVPIPGEFQSAGLFIEKQQSAGPAELDPLLPRDRSRLQAYPRPRVKQGLQDNAAFEAC